MAYAASGRHSGIVALPGRDGEIPAMKQLVAERDAKSWPRALDDARRPKCAERFGTRSIEVSGGVLAQQIRGLLGKSYVISPGRTDEVPLRFEHVVHERPDRPSVTYRRRVKV